MGNIGPSKVRYDVLPIPSFGVQDADLWKLDLPPALGRAAPAPELVPDLPAPESTR